MTGRPVFLRRVLRTIGLAILVCSPAGAQDRAEASRLDIPSTVERVKAFDAQAAALQLSSQVLPELDVPLRTKLLLAAGSGEGFDQLTEPEVGDVLRTIEALGRREAALEIFLHRSKILDIVPSSAEGWLPLVHDALLLFLAESSLDRLRERVHAQTRLEPDASRGQLLLAFMARTPTLQKLGQVLARNRALDPDVRQALQTLENSIQTTTVQELESLIYAEWAESEDYRHCRAAFDSDILAEASVGAVVRADLTRAAGKPSVPAVAKVIKPYAVENLRSELSVLATIIDYLDAEGDAYRLGSATLSDLFQEIRDALSKEVEVVKEQRNLGLAFDYYADRPGVLVPRVLACSTPNITFMSFVDGQKLTNAYEGEIQKRRRLAKGLSDLLSYDVLFAEQEQALFHGDPHAGNVLSAPSENEPYRIALLDWGLAGTLPRDQRLELVQLLLGLYLDDAKRLRNHLGGLVETDPLSEEHAEAEVVRRSELIERFREAREPGQSLFSSLELLLTHLARDGYRLRYNTTLYVKSQLTIAGILDELDSDFRQDQYVLSRLRGQAMKEFPKRLGRTIWFPSWNSHSYRSLLSNEDVKDVQWFRFKRGLRWLGRGIWKILSAPF